MGITRWRPCRATHDAYHQSMIRHSLAPADPLTLTVSVTPDMKAKLFRGLADPSRLSILETLRGGPRNVGDIVDRTGLSQSNVSNHLACLLDCGLVLRQQRGRFAFYELSDDRVDDFLSAAGRLISDVAAGLPACGSYREGETRA